LRWLWSSSALTAAATPRPSAAGSPRRRHPLQARLHRASRQAKALREHHDGQPRIVVERREDSPVGSVKLLQSDHSLSIRCGPVDQIDHHPERSLRLLYCFCSNSGNKATATARALRLQDPRHTTRSLNNASRKDAAPLIDTCSRIVFPPALPRFRADEFQARSRHGKSP
jgi:hypothetical protein